MKKSSWIVLSLCVVLGVFLVVIYRLSQGVPETLTQAQAETMLHTMQTAVAHKNVNAIMDFVTPDPETRIANLNHDQLRVLLARAFHYSSRLHADVSHIAFQGAPGEATLQFDLVMVHEEEGLHAQDYAGRITLHLKRVDVPHLMGLYQAKEWRIAAAETTGPDPANFGDL